MKIKNLPNFIKTGIIIIPFLIIIGFLLQYFIAGKINFFFWAIVPAIIFEETLEKSLPSVADSFLLNVIFIIVFWFSIGTLMGAIIEKIKKRF